MSETAAASEQAAAAADERRRYQRFIARRGGEACFWLLNAEQRIALNDLSSEGFSIPLVVPPQMDARFSFILAREGVPDRIEGEAEVANYIASQSQLGCRFVSFDGNGADKLRDWLVAHVLMTASVRITEKEAEMIVSGGSLI